MAIIITWFIFIPQDMMDSSLWFFLWDQRIFFFLVHLDDLYSHFSPIHFFSDIWMVLAHSLEHDLIYLQKTLSWFNNVTLLMKYYPTSLAVVLMQYISLRRIYFQHYMTMLLIDMPELVIKSSSETNFSIKIIGFKRRVGLLVHTELSTHWQ